MANAGQCAFCFEVLVAHFEGRSPAPLSVFTKAIEADSSSSSLESTTSALSSTFSAAAAVSASTSTFPLFVTWNTIGKNGTRLRGCIGTFEPQPLEKGLANYANIAYVLICVPSLIIPADLFLRAPGHSMIRDLVLFR